MKELNHIKLKLIEDLKVFAVIEGSAISHRLSNLNTLAILMCITCHPVHLELLKSSLHQYIFAVRSEDLTTCLTREDYESI